MVSCFRSLAFAVLALGLVGARPAGELTGRVVGVSDGDTLTMLTPGRREVKVRLDQIDAPETNQPWGANSKRALSRQVFGRTVSVRRTGEDRYGRTLGEVSVAGQDVNAAMVGGGAAWAYRQYLTDRGLLTLERQARTNRRGLWALPVDQVTAPWTWRAEQRAEDGKPASRSGFACGTKRVCSQMTSCGEARQHLDQCGVQRLDGDRDGMPCETLCRG